MEGTCKFCLGHKRLIQSHFLSRGLYDLCRAASSEPVILTSKVVMHTSRRVKDYLLCAPCDNFLGQKGENWLLPRRATMSGSFPLFEILRRVPPDVNEQDSQGYAAARNPGIDVAAITHFAMGIYWKASVHSWSSNETEPYIKLGPYSEQLRRFLRAELPFPEHMVLVVGALPHASRFIHFVAPYRGSNTAHRNFVFAVPGMQFNLLVGKGIPPETREICFCRNPFQPIVVADPAGEMKDVYREVSREAHRSKRLLEHFATTRRPDTGRPDP